MNLELRTPRQKRLLSLLVRQKVTSRQIHITVGAMNAPGLIAELRRLGWTVYCKYETTRDRDNKPCRIGLYRLADEQKALARQLLGGSSYD